jgi:demethylmenaquinone methyltransferase / 2-methoxy-6-polyprenyl-1,4-benzoquinol methylase
MSGPRAPRRAADGSPHPDRGQPGFEDELQAMFTHIADKYDWFDHLASLGQDYLWRPRALWALDRYRNHRPITRFLDIGCGPGDLTLLAAGHYPSSTAVGADFTPAMLRNARIRTARDARAPRVRYVRADALHLPFADGRFDLVLSGFVARNLPDLAQAFAEFRRVLRPGGTVLTLEITEPDDRRVRDLFHAYFDHVVPWLGAAFQSAGPYRYLPESLRYLPDRAGMFQLMERAGFEHPVAATQAMGTVTGYLAAVPERGPSVAPKA